MKILSIMLPVRYISLENGLLYEFLSEVANCTYCTGSDLKANAESLLRQFICGKEMEFQS